MIDLNMAQTFPLPGWVVMWVLMLSLFIIGKIIAVIPLWKHTKSLSNVAAFLFLWVGMSASDWQMSIRVPRRQLLVDALVGTSFLMAGILLLWGFARHLESHFAQAWCGLIALVWMLHFGIFRLMAVFWLWRGRAVRTVMHRPMSANSLAYFWGRCWNRAFRDLMHQTVFAPIRRRYGSMAAVVCVFSVSGLLHELIITVPAGAGYGLPLSYFLLQATGILLQRQFQLYRWWITHVFTLLPIGLVFPEPFVMAVMHPFFVALGAFEG